jgi:hypothetical protein
MLRTLPPPKAEIAGATKPAGPLRTPQLVAMARQRAVPSIDMCRSIKTLRRLDEPATDEEIEAAALQFVRKVSGFRQPSQKNAPAFDAAVDEVAGASRRLLDALTKR